MKRALGYGLVLLAASAVATQCAHASGPEAVSATLFFLSGSGAPPARVAQGYLGVGIRDVPADQVAPLKLKEARGAEIVQVDHDAPAGKAGLREYDVILRVNGQAIEGEEQLRRMLRESPPGTALTLLVSRDGQQMTVTTQTANRDEVERQAWEQHLTVPEPQEQPSEIEGSIYFAAPAAPASPAPPVRGNSFLGPLLMNPSYTGAMLETMSSQLAGYFGVPGGAGLLVRSVEANSPAALAGMRAGDVVVRANAKPVASSADWTKAIKDSHGRPLAVVVLRDKKELTLTLTPDNKRRSSLEQPSQDFQRAVLAPNGFFWLQLS